MPSADGRVAAAEVSGALHRPQNWLLGRLTCPQAAQAGSSGLPQASQNALVALLSLSQYRQCIRETLGSP